MGDLLRNYLFMLLPKRGPHVHATVWRPMQDMLGTEHIETLAYLDLLLRGHPELQRKDTYRGQQRRLQPIENDEAAVEAEVVELAAAPVTSRRSSTRRPSRTPRCPRHSAGSATGAPRRCTRCSWCCSTGASAASRPLARRCRARSTWSPTLVRRMLAGRTASGLNRTLALAAVTIAGTDGDAAAALREFLSQPRRFWPDDEQLAAGIAERNFYWSGKASQRRFVLRRLEESYGHREPIAWDLVKVQVEHILSQTPTPAWLDMLAGDVDPGESVAELHQRVVPGSATSLSPPTTRTWATSPSPRSAVDIIGSRT